MEKKNYYITTAIPYASGKPHIGNTYEAILADAIARFKRLDGYDVYFQTGTDEHGQKVEKKAELSGKTPQELADANSNELKRIWDLADVSYDRFVRTTDPQHEKTVQHIFEKLYNQGDIYLGTYEGLYCTACESFFMEKDLIDGKCPDCGGNVTPEKEETYFLKMSKYQDRLLQYINDHPTFIQPESRKNEVVNNFIKPGLRDLCVTRTSFSWGVPVPFDAKHVIYVWIDALSNYITFIGYDTDHCTDEFNQRWPADVHLIGKDILRFHTIYWPIMLMMLDLPMPKKIFGHPWLLFGSEKMSKSKGNVMYADDLIALFGVDAVRYYVLATMPFANDGCITYDLLIDKTNSDLVNVLGNLVNRTITMANKYFNGYVENKGIKEELDESLLLMSNDLYDKVKTDIDNIDAGKALEDIFILLRTANKYVDDTAPWVLYKENKLDRLETVIFNLLEAIRISAILLQGFIPTTAKQILDQLGIVNGSFEKIHNNDCFNVREAQIIYQRIDAKTKLEEITQYLNNH